MAFRRGTRRTRPATRAEQQKAQDSGQVVPTYMYIDTGSPVPDGGSSDCSGSSSYDSGSSGSSSYDSGSSSSSSSTSYDSGGYSSSDSGSSSCDGGGGF